MVSRGALGNREENKSNENILVFATFISSRCSFAKNLESIWSTDFTAGFNHMIASFLEASKYRRQGNLLTIYFT